MKKQLLLVITSSLVMHAALFGMDPKKQIDVTEQANAEIAPEQMTHLALNLTAYKNIVQASKDAAECAAYKKSVEQFTASLNNLVQTYTQELAVRLNQDEQAVLKDILANVKDMANIIKVEVVRINDASIDQTTKNQRIADLNAKMVEQYQQLAYKMMPFGIVAQEQKINPEEMDKNFDEVLTKVISYLNSLSDSMKPSK